MSWLDLSIKVVPDSLIQRAKALQETLRFEQVEKERQARLEEEIRRRLQGQGQGKGERTPRRKLTGSETIFGRRGPDRTIERRPIGNAGGAGDPSIVGIAGISDHRTTWLWPINAAAPIEFTYDSDYQTPEEEGLTEQVFDDLQLVSATNPPNATALWEFNRHVVVGQQNLTWSFVLPIGEGRGIYVLRRVFWHVIDQVYYRYYFESTQVSSGTPCGNNTFSMGEMQANTYSLTESPILDSVHAWVFDENTATPIDVPNDLAVVLRTWFPVAKPVFSSEQVPITSDGVTGGGLVGTGSTVRFLTFPPEAPSGLCNATVLSDFVAATRSSTTVAGDVYPTPNYYGILTDWGLRTQYGLGRLGSFQHALIEMYSPAIYTMIAKPTVDPPTLTFLQTTYPVVRTDFLDSVPQPPRSFIDGTYANSAGPSSQTLQTYTFRVTTTEPILSTSPVPEGDLIPYDVQPTLVGPIANADITLENIKIATDWGQPQYCQQKAFELGFNL